MSARCFWLERVTPDDPNDTRVRRTDTGEVYVRIGDAPPGAMWDAPWMHDHGKMRDTFLLDWSKYDGRVHLCLQNSVNASAGLQGASTYYARMRLMGQGDGAQGPGAPHSKVIAFETMAEAQLMGQCPEAYGNLRDWELLCGTRLDPRARPVSGYGNGGRRPDGASL